MSVMLLSNVKLLPHTGISLSDKVSSNVRGVTALQREPTQGRNRLVTRIVLVPLAAFSMLSMDSSIPNSVAHAGVLSGFRGWDFELPRITIPDAAIQNADKQKRKYENFDENFKKSALVQELLKRSQDNAAKNKREILDKYCVRQAEWGVGDCSLASSTPEEKEKLLELMKKKMAGTTVENGN